jgi:hypothetical protein
MEQSRVIGRGIIIIILLLTIGNLNLGDIFVHGPEGPHYIGGRVYTSEGVNPNGDFEGAYAAVIINHEGENRTYLDYEGLEMDDYDDSYWYAVTIPDGLWDVGDTYWIVVDGRGWGELNHTCVDHDNPEVNSWEVSLNSEHHDVNIVNSTFDPDGDNGGNGGITTTDDYDSIQQYLLIGVIILIIVFVIVTVILVIRPKRKEK